MAPERPPPETPIARDMVISPLKPSLVRASNLAPRALLLLLLLMAGCNEPSGKPATEAAKKASPRP